MTFTSVLLFAHSNHFKTHVYWLVRTTPQKKVRKSSPVARVIRYAKHLWS